MFKHIRVYIWKCGILRENAYRTTKYRNGCKCPPHPDDNVDEFSTVGQ